MSASKSGRLLDLSQGRGDVFKLDPRTIVVEEGFNARNFDDEKVREHIETLCASIAANGVLNPVTVRYRDGKAVLVDGECRLKATLVAIERGAGIATIPAIGAPTGGNDADRLVVSYTKNVGLPFSELEVAQVVRRLFAYGYEENDVATKLGLKPAKVRWLVDLTATSPAMQALIRKNQISPTEAVRLSREHGDTQAAEIASSAIAIGQSAGGTAKAMPRHIALAKEATKMQGSTAGGPAAAPRLSTSDAKTMLGAFKEIASILATRSSEPSAKLTSVRRITKTILEQFSDEADSASSTEAPS